MNLLRPGLIAMITCLTISSIKAQTADEIIDKYVAAIGGKDVLSGIKSIYLEGTASAMGNDYPTKTTILVGKAFRNETDVNGVQIIQCITDTGGWMMNPMMGQSAPVILPADAVKKGKMSLDIGGGLFNFKDKGFTDSLEGREDFQGVSAYKIRLTEPDIVIDYLIDPSTYYILKIDVKYTGDNTINSRTCSNYKKTDAGFVIPYTVGITNMGYDIKINYTKAEINKDVDPKIFEMKQ
jgi:hypothetical protein